LIQRKELAVDLAQIEPARLSALAWRFYFDESDECLFDCDGEVQPCFQIG